MNIAIAVADPVPSYRQGLVTALAEAGFHAEGIENPRSWVKARGRRALLVTVTLPEESSTLAALSGWNHDVVVVALLSNVRPAAYGEALRQGSSGAVARDAAPETVVEVLRAALDRHCVLPVDVARCLAEPDDFNTELLVLSDWETKSLRLLGNGATVAEVAKETSYSERETFRLLHRLYERMGARNRTQAVVKAARIGLFDPAPDAGSPLPSEPAG